MNWENFLVNHWQLICVDDLFEIKKLKNVSANFATFNDCGGLFQVLNWNFLWEIQLRNIQSFSYRSNSGVKLYPVCLFRQFI